MTSSQEKKLVLSSQWVLTITIGIVGFFLEYQIQSFDSRLKDQEQRIREEEKKSIQSQATDQLILGKLDEIIGLQKKWEKDIADFYYMNPQLKKPDAGN